MRHRVRIATFAVTLAVTSACDKASPCPESTTDGQKLDLVFLLDVTGSMGTQLDVMKQNVSALVDQLGDRRYDTRFAGFSISDKSPYESSLAFTADRKQFQDWVAALALVDGGDVTENSLDPVNAALALDFRSDARKTLLLITDAPPHQRGEPNSPAKFTLQETADSLSAPGHEGTETFYSSPASHYSAFATSLGWPFDRSTILYQWLAVQQGVYFPLDPPPSAYEQWQQAHATHLKTEYPLRVPDWASAEHGRIPYEEWLLLTAIAADPRSDRENLGLGFLEKPAEPVSAFWNQFFTEYGSQGRCLVQRAIQLGYSFHSDECGWSKKCIDWSERRIGFENSRGLYEALNEVVRKEDMTQEEWQMFDELFLSRVDLVRKANPAFRMNDLLANRADYAELDAATLKQEVREIRLYGEFYAGVKDAGLEEELARAQGAGWTVRARSHRFYDWLIDDDDKIIYIADDEFDRKSGPHHLRQALAEVNGYFSEAEMLRQYAKLYGNDPEAQRYFAVMMGGEYRIVPTKGSGSIDRDEKTIRIDRSLSAEDAAKELHDALEEIYGKTASQFIRGAGKGVTTLGALLEMDDRTLQELGARDIAVQLRRDIATGAENAGSLQTFVEESLRDEAIAATVGFAATRAPHLLSMIRNKRLKPNSVTHLAHNEFVDRATGQVLWRAGRNASAAVNRDVDELTKLLRQVAEEAIGDVYYSRALPRRVGSMPYRKGMEGHLRGYIAHELKRTPENWKRPAHLTGNAYHQQFMNILRERLRSDKNFAPYKDRLTVDTPVPGIPGRPDVTLDVGDGRRAIWDLTTSWEAGTLEEGVRSAGRGKVKRLAPYLPKISKYVTQGASDRVTHLTDIPYFPTTYREGW